MDKDLGIGEFTLTKMSLLAERVEMSFNGGQTFSFTIESASDLKGTKEDSGAYNMNLGPKEVKTEA